MESYIEVQFKLKDGIPAEVLVASLEQLEADSFWEEPPLLKAYFLKEKWNEKLIATIQSLEGKYFLSFHSQSLPDVNWNQKWEANFDPVAVSDICYIRASFHEKRNGFQYQIEINPKMSFGTGHHATTYMMVEAMTKHTLENKRVLDYGAGTGILAILGKKMGANVVHGVEIEPIAVENAIENAAINDTSEINFQCGDIGIINGKYDIILANINRNVLISTMPQIVDLLEDKGVVLFSGILIEDQSLMEEKISSAGLNILDIQTRGEWVCITSCKS